MSDQQDEIVEWRPTLSERIRLGISDPIQSGLEALGTDRYLARNAARAISGGDGSPAFGWGVIDVVPFAGTGIQLIEGAEGVGDAIESARRGDYVGAGLDALFAGLGLLPGVKPTARAAKAARRRMQKKPETGDAHYGRGGRAKRKLKEVLYDAAQEGPFYRVSKRTAEPAGSDYSKIREDLRKADVARGGARGDVPQSISDEEIVRLIQNPKNFVRRTADRYTRDTSNVGYDLPPMPAASLAKQSAIGRIFRLAASGDPRYKQVVFESYGKQFPELIEATGAKNYDQLLESAYRQLEKETIDQFRHLPVTLSYHRAGEGNYSTSGEMLRDVFGNRHLYVYQGGDPHDFLNTVDPQTQLTSNDMFRAVHDFFGHAVHGNAFGPKGEEIAYGAHSRMYSPLARLAMASETRGQNSFVNYTPINADLKARISRLNELRNEATRRGNQADVKFLDKELEDAWGSFKYAPQKSVLLPPEFLGTDYSGGMPGYVQAIVSPDPGTAVSGRLTHFSHSPEITQLDPSRYGSGIQGREMERLRSTQNPVMERSYFYTGDPEQIRKETGLGIHRYGTTGTQLYDVSQDPMSFRVLATEANRTPWTSKYNQGMRNPAQAMTDVERMIREYGYEGMINPEMGMGITFRPTAVQPFARGGLAALRRR
jgi:hypothetical protein